MKLIRPFTGLAVLAMTGAMAACSGDAYPPAVGGYATTYADAVPPDIYTYPSVPYEGSNAYLVNDIWFYPTARGWVRLHHESPELSRYRAHYREAPQQVRATPDVRRVQPEPRFPPPPPMYSYPSR